MTAGPCVSLAKIELIIHDKRNHPPRRSEAQPHWPYVGQMTTHILGLTARRESSVNVLPIGWQGLPPPFPAALEVWSAMPKIDLVADLGESFGAWTMGADEAILDLLTSANVACGFHAGDPRIMDATVGRCVERGVAIGAHPSFPDV